MEGQTVIAGAVFVSAFKTLAMVAEQQRPGRQQSITLTAAIQEGSGEDRRDGDCLMALLERTIARPGAADHLLHAPAIAAG